ncbi:4-alpha-glucanotransferase [Elusimicrobium posterum]|uniref:4-alpha-glucanotransferase n=1 Tax=Elusimicrobium posterum TaxID=3116653 RepID=UPI003C757203
MGLIFDRKTAGILMPLYAMRSESDWGVGDFAALEDWVSYFASIGTGVVQILPINEMAPGQACPYNALSAFAIDPVYISIKDVPEINASEKAQDFIKRAEHLYTFWRSADKVYYVMIRDAKQKVLLNAFEYFVDNELAKNTERAQKFNTYCTHQAHWLHNYCLFRALKDYYKWQSWTTWPEPLKNADVTALAEFEEKNRNHVTYFKYLQFVADEQIAKVTKLAKEKNVKIFGDIPFGINMDSSDVWAERENFNLNSEVGAPPDQFSTEGQRWGLPAYNWTKMQGDGFIWWRRKIARACELYDIFRLDHLVGLFRTYIYDSPEDKGHFDIEGDYAQGHRGYLFLKMVQEMSNGKQPVGEDLGVIPDFVRSVMKDLEIPGYKILRWEQDNGWYRDPAAYPWVSVAALSTHDTETLRDWWEIMTLHERANAWEMISSIKTDGAVPFGLGVQETTIKRVLDSGSALAMFSIMDIAGTLDRINIPGTVSDANWSTKFDALTSDIETKYFEQISSFKRLLQETGRSTVI